MIDTRIKNILQHPLDNEFRELCSTACSIDSCAALRLDPSLGKISPGFPHPRHHHATTTDAMRLHLERFITHKCSKIDVKNVLQHRTEKSGTKNKTVRKGHAGFWRASFIQLIPFEA